MRPVEPPRRGVAAGSRSPPGCSVGCRNGPGPRPAGWLRLGIAGGLSYGALVGVQHAYDYATTSPRFEARALVFEPTPHVSDAELRGLMGITPGTNILSLEVDGLAGEDLRASVGTPRQRHARASRHAHRRGEEHQPRAVLLAGEFYLVGDDEGHPVQAAGDRRARHASNHHGRRSAVGVHRAPSGRRRSSAKRSTSSRSTARSSAHGLSEINIDDTGRGHAVHRRPRQSAAPGRTEIEAALTRYDALRAALGEESDKLAVAHLDAASASRREGPRRRELLPHQGCTGIRRRRGRAGRTTGARAQARAGCPKKTPRKSKARKGGRRGKSRLPRYE